MIFRLHVAEERPIYARIGDQVRFAVASGSLRAGDLVPSVRELSRQLVVNPNTVARAYRDLQADGLVEPVRGMGLQVAEGAAAACREARLDYVRGRLREAIGEARRSLLPAGEIEAILREEWDRDWPDGEGEGAAVAGPAGGKGGAR